jgi:cytoskeletal protein RodZ
MAELGRLLTQARQSRGLTLEAAERDTRIARRYLEALEREDFGALPAQVFARGFLRSYSQYLGLDPAQVLPLMPREGPEPRIQALPEVTESTGGTINASLIIAGVLVLTVVLIGYALFRAASPSTSVRTATPVSGEATPGATRTVPQGTLPDFRGETVDVATARLRELGVPYVVIQLPREDATAGEVYEQNPRSGTRVSQGLAVTLWVARP